MTQRIAVLGNGGFGTAIALILLENGHDVVIWGNDATYLERVRAKRENTKYLPDIELPQGLHFTSDLAEAVRGAKVIVSAVPTRFLRGVIARLAGCRVPRATVLSLTKGIDHETLERPSEIWRAAFPGRSVAVLSGPSHAEEVARRIPASVVVAAPSAATARKLQELLTTERFRVYTNTDPLGVELGGALKNVIAIAAGVSDGLGFGDNTKSALLTRGLVEMVRLATKLGARKATFTGLAGVGDLITTAFSPHGRNRAVGQRLGEGTPLDRILRETEKVAEGVYTTKAVMALAREYDVELPIAHEVHEMLFADKNPSEALRSLMNRSTKNEAW
jgi:glycerol-3-phosphate dehydrogenase (NAD(P)+)